MWSDEIRSRNDGILSPSRFSLLSFSCQRRHLHRTDAKLDRHAFPDCLRVDNFNKERTRESEVPMIVKSFIFFSSDKVLFLLRTIFRLVKLASAESVLAVCTSSTVLDIVLFVNIMQCFCQGVKSICCSFFRCCHPHKLGFLARLRSSFE